MMKIFLTFFGIFFLLFAANVWAELPIKEFPNLHSIVIFAPHPDDESLFAAGIIQSAVKNKIPLKVVVVTNGDLLGPAYGNRREVETVNAMNALGAKEKDIIFLGYADRLMMTLFNADDPMEIFESHAKRLMTYAHRGICKDSYHECWTNEEALYSRSNVVADFNHLLELYQPDGIFTTSRLDAHPDHRAVEAFLVEAIQNLSKVDNTFHPTLYEAIVHAKGEMLWPYPSNNKIKMPKMLKNDPNIWTKHFISFKVPSRHLKLLAIHQYLSQLLYSPWLIDYAKEVEPFAAYSF